MDDRALSRFNIRSNIWDTLHGYVHRTPLPDVDVIYYDPVDVDETLGKSVEEKLRELLPSVPWSVKNQARMHVVNGQHPYASSTDAMSKFPETATAVGVRLLDDNRIELAAPWGVSDLLNRIVSPTPLFANRNPANVRIYEDRIAKKKWEQTCVFAPAGDGRCRFPVRRCCCVRLRRVDSVLFG